VNGLNEYQLTALQTAVYPNIGNNLPYAVLGLAGEAGEVAGQLSKYIRKPCDAEEVGEVYLRKQRLADELGDVLWFVACAAHELGYSMSEIADLNVSKLASRKANGTIGSTGKRDE
jgi:NTP pyrophosphatase (non-canonical NTP hydrolase)